MAVFTTRRSQLQWLALLAVAVVLPTVSLLWFMSRVIANERLVVRQKLTALYQDKLTDANAKTESLFAARLASLDKIKPAANPYALFRRLVLEENCQGVVVWDVDGSAVYPQSVDVAGSDAPAGSLLAEARQQEFARKQYAEAAQLYHQLSTDSDPRVAVAAIVGQSRCLSRLGRLEEAIDECQKAAFAVPPDREDAAWRLAVENARLLLLSLLKQSGPSPSHSGILHRTINALGNDLYHPAGDRALLPADQNLFIAKKVLETLRNSNAAEDAKTRDQLEKLADAEELSIAAAEKLRPLTGQFDGFVATDLDPKPVYGLRHRTRRQPCWFCCPGRESPQPLPATTTRSPAPSRLIAYWMPPAILWPALPSRKANPLPPQTCLPPSPVGRWNCILPAAMFSRRQPIGKSPCMSGPASW